MKKLTFGVMVAVFLANCFWAATDYPNLVIATKAFEAAASKRDAVGIQIAAVKQDMHRNNFLFECTWFVIIGVGAALYFKDGNRASGSRP